MSGFQAGVNGLAEGAEESAFYMPLFLVPAPAERNYEGNKEAKLFIPGPWF